MRRFCFLIKCWVGFNILGFLEMWFIGLFGIIILILGGIIIWLVIVIL